MRVLIGRLYLIPRTEATWFGVHVIRVDQRKNFLSPPVKDRVP